MFLDGPTIVAGPKETVSALGHTAVLRCGHLISSNPPPDISWLRPVSEIPVQEDENYMFLRDDVVGIYSLLIPVVQLIDRGFWTCKVRVERSIFGPHGHAGNTEMLEETASVYLSVDSEYNNVALLRAS